MNFIPFFNGRRGRENTQPPSHTHPHRHHPYSQQQHQQPLQQQPTHQQPTHQQPTHQQPPHQQQRRYAPSPYSSSAPLHQETTNPSGFFGNLMGHLFNFNEPYLEPHLQQHAMHHQHAMQQHHHHHQHDMRHHFHTDNWFEDMLNNTSAFLFGEGPLYHPDNFDTMFHPFQQQQQQHHHHRQRHGMNHAHPRGPAPPPTSDKAIEKFPTFVYTSEQEESMKSLNEFSEMGCSICISDFARDEVLLSLPCQHTFHKECIIPWLHQHNTCPVCRYELTVEDQQLERERIKRMTEKFTVEGLRIMEIGAQVNSLVPSIQKCKHNFDEFCRRCNEAEKNGVVVDHGRKKQFLDKLKRKLSELENVLENKLYQLDELQQFKEERIKKQRKLQIVKIQSMQQIISSIKSRIADIIAS